MNLTLTTPAFNEALKSIKRWMPSEDRRFSLLIGTTLADVLPNPKPDQACDDWINEHDEYVKTTVALLGEQTFINFPTILNYTRNAMRLRYSYINAQDTTLYHYNIRAVFPSEIAALIVSHEEIFSICRQHALILLAELKQE